MYVDGTPEAVAVVAQISATMPSSLVGVAGASAEGLVEEAGFGRALHRFCDSSVT
jgi:hypothetical protein